MTERIINPKPRFVTLSAETGSAGTANTMERLSTFKFPQDSLIHSITINSNFLCNGAGSEVSSAVAFTESISFSNSVSLTEVRENAVWLESLINPIAGTITASKSVFIDLQKYFAKSNTQINCYMTAINGATTRGQVNATVSFNTLQEWKNFKE
jgi:hypothetical protein